MRLPCIAALVATGALALAGCGGDDESDVQAFCDKVDEIRAAEDPFANLNTGSVEDTRAALEEAQALFGEIADVAPGEIQEDVQQAEQFFDEFVTAVGDASSPEDLLGVATEFQAQAEDFQATSARLEEYTNENCGEEAAQP
jgi:hypothetical protein